MDGVTITIILSSISLTFNVLIPIILHKLFNLEKRVSRLEIVCNMVNRCKCICNNDDSDNT